MLRTIAFFTGLGLAASVAAGPLDSCRQAVVDYAYHWDQGEVADFAATFTDDAILSLGGNVITGRDAIAGRLRESGSERVYRHLMTTIKLTAVNDTMAKGVSYVTVYIGEPGENGLARVDGFALVGEYHDTFRIGADGRCRIAERTLVPVMQQR